MDDAHSVGEKNTPPVSSTSGDRALELELIMGHIPFTWLPPMDSNAAATLAEAFPTPFPSATADDGAAAAARYLNYTRMYAALVHPAAAARQQSAAHAAAAAAAEAAAAAAARRRRQAEEEEEASIRLVHLLITCTGAIQAGDYSVAHGNLSEARAILKQIPTSTGIGRVGAHFADALAQRMFPAAYPPHALPTAAAAALSPSPTTAAAAAYGHFYDAGPYLKFAHSTANRAILRAFEGCRRVHVIDFALMQGLQWPALMAELAAREGGPPEELRITGVGPNPAQAAAASGGGGGRDELHEVGVRLAEFARSVRVPFTFQGVCADQLDRLCDWIHFTPGGSAGGGYDALAINSVLQLHRLLVDPDAAAGDDDAAPVAPIDVVLRMVVKLKPNVFTVVEQEADHNRPQLLERFTNALFHYATMFDSLEAMSCPPPAIAGSSSSTTITGSLAEAYLRGEIFDIICGEGSARTERHELFSGGWKERLARAGLTQVELGAAEANLATADLIGATSFSGSGFSILQCSGSLALAWHGRPLYVATAWHAMGVGGEGANAASAGSASADIAHAKGDDSYYYKGCNGSSSVSIKGNRGLCGEVPGGMAFL